MRRVKDPWNLKIFLLHGASMLQYLEGDERKKEKKKEEEEVQREKERDRREKNEREMELGLLFGWPYVLWRER